MSLTAEGGTYTTKTTGWRESEFNGNTPLNKRKGRFLSVVQLYKVYNMSFTSSPPNDMVVSFSLPSLTGDNTQWVGIKIYYPLPNALSVTHANGSATRTILASETNYIDSYVDTCGANKYFYKNNTIHFIVTANASCSVRVTLTSSIQIKATLSINIAEFHSSGGLAKFV